MQSYKIYISPANHYKRYYYKGHTEKEEMEKLALLFIKELEKYEGLIPVMTSVYDEDEQYTGRPEEARDKSCDIYVALHSNSGGGKGACLFYHPAYELSEKLALELVISLNKICPIKSNRYVQPAIYAWGPNKWNFGELRLPARYGIVPILIEHEFHDTADGAKWIIENLPQIAAADAAAIAKVLGVKKKAVQGDVNGDGEVSPLDASLVLRYDAGLISLSDDALKNADMNGDGKISPLDASIILQKDAGLK